MLLLQFNLDDRRAQEYFDYAGYHTRRMTPIFRQIGELVHGYVEAQFDTEGMAMSGGWAQLAPRTVADRGSAHPILEREGILRHDVTTRPRPGAQFGGGLHYGNGWLTFAPTSHRNGTDLVDVHSHGREPQNVDPKTGMPTGGMPARPVWETPTALYAEINYIAFRWLQELKSSNIRRRGLTMPRPADLAPNFSFQGEL